MIQRSIDQILSDLDPRSKSSEVKKIKILFANNSFEFVVESRNKNLAYSNV